MEQLIPGSSLASVTMMEFRSSKRHLVANFLSHHFVIGLVELKLDHLFLEIVVTTPEIKFGQLYLLTMDEQNQYSQMGSDDWYQHCLSKYVLSDLDHYRYLRAVAIIERIVRKIRGCSINELEITPYQVKDHIHVTVNGCLITITKSTIDVDGKYCFIDEATSAKFFNLTMSRQETVIEVAKVLSYYWLIDRDQRDDKSWSL